MKSDLRSIGAAVFVFALTNIVGAIFFFGPIASADVGEGISVHPLIAISVYVALGVGLLHFAARVTGGAFKAASIIAAAQVILVDVDFVFRGERGIETAAASAVLIVVTWFSAAFVYSFFSRPDHGNEQNKTHS